MSEEKVETKDIVNEMKNFVGQPTNLLVTFDTTGSMSAAIRQVREKLRELVEKMTQDIPGLLIAFIAHGDYCDGPKMLSVLDFTNDLEKIMKFITEAPNTNGGDSPECYEKVLSVAQTLQWGEAGGSMIMIGDASPHEADDPQNKEKLNWREEIAKLRAKKVDFFPLQCLKHSYNTVANEFWDACAEIAGTELLLLENFANVSGQIEAAAYAAAPDDVYELYCTRITADCATDAELACNVNKLGAYRSRKKIELEKKAETEEK